jgi:hypothetical protein
MTNKPKIVIDPELQARLDNIKPIPATIFWGCLFVICIIWLLGFIPWFSLNAPDKFGDSFGFINSLLTALSLSGVIASLWLQRLELVEQRKQLETTQWEIRKSAAAETRTADELQLQSQLSMAQSFHSTLDGLSKFSEHLDGSDLFRNRQKAQCYQLLSYKYRLLLIHSLHEKTSIINLVSNFQQDLTGINALLADLACARDAFDDIKIYQSHGAVRSVSKQHLQEARNRIESDHQLLKVFSKHNDQPYNFDVITNQSDGDPIKSTKLLQDALRNLSENIRDRIDRLTENSQDNT